MRASFFFLPKRPLRRGPHPSALRAATFPKGEGLFSSQIKPDKPSPSGDWSLPPPVAETDRRNVGIAKERLRDYCDSRMVPEGTEAEYTLWVHITRRNVGNRKERL